MVMVPARAGLALMRPAAGLRHQRTSGIRSRRRSRFFIQFLVVLAFSGAVAMAHGACGDGIIEYQSEQCDDGNHLSDDGCSARCESETGEHHLPSCGDHRLSGLEQCDGTPGCSSRCELSLRTPTLVSISHCGTYSQSNARYVLATDLSSTGDCLVLDGQNIELDGRNHRIDSGGIGIRIKEWNRRNIIIRNIVINTAGASGIFGRTVKGALISNVWIRNLATEDASIGGNVVDFKESTGIVLERCVLENHVKGVKNRHQFAGASVKLGANAIVRDCVFIGTPQNGLVASSKSHFFNNYANGGTEIKRGDLSVSHTNNFFVGAWNSSDIDINNNVVVNAGYWAQKYEMKGTVADAVIDVDLAHLLRYHLTGDPTQRPLKIIAGRPQNRGLFGIDGSQPQRAIAIYNNYSSSYVPPTNEEYQGCQLGGATGIQLESIVRDSTVFSNTLVAVAAECDADAAKPSSQQGAEPNLWQHNELVAIKVEKDGAEGTDEWPGIAVAVDLRESMPGTLFQRNRITTMVVDRGGNLLTQGTTGGNDVALWRLLSTRDADGFVFDRTHLDLSRTPGQRLLSQARTWTDGAGDRPAPQTIIWQGVTFEDSASEALFASQIGSVWSGWDLGRGLRNPQRYGQVRVVVRTVGQGRGDSDSQTGRSVDDAGRRQIDH